MHTALYMEIPDMRIFAQNKVSRAETPRTGKDNI